MEPSTKKLFRLPTRCLGMNLSLTFSPNWYILLFSFLAAWCLIMVFRRKTALNELKRQVAFGLCALAVAFVMEFFAVSTNLWNYSPSNWPLLLWPTYFVAALFCYQLTLSVNELFRRTKNQNPPARFDGVA